MANKPLRPCRRPGCAALTRDGWCDKHRPRMERKASAAYHSWYSLPVWTDRLRPDQLSHEPFCRECARRYPTTDPRHRTEATVVDHITPHEGDWTLFTSPGNLQSLCKRHHDMKTAHEQRQKKEK